MKYLSIVRELLHIKSKKAGKNTVRFKSYSKNREKNPKDTTEKQKWKW
jgi:hypothetical protein